MSTMLKASMMLVMVLGLMVYDLGRPVLAASEPARSRRVYYVSPMGSDENPGTRDRPFRTIEKAREVLRGLHRSMTGDLTVYLRGGTYALSRTLQFDPRDSGANGHYVIYKAYRGEGPILSGGRRITGWEPDSEGRWKARTDIDNFRQLYVNGVRAVRARGGPLPGAERYGQWNVMDGVAGYQTTDDSMARWRNQSDIELGYYVSWSHIICKIQSITPHEAGGAIVTMQQPGFYLATRKEGVQANLPDYVENALELLDEPGEWYLDRTAHVVYYLPRAGENMAEVEVIAPAVERLLEVRGTLEEPVHHLRFEGLTFAHATWLRPSEIGHPDVQANFIPPTDKLFERNGTIANVHNECLKSPANVVLDAAKSVRFERCTFTRLGGAGLDLQHGSQDNVVSGCRFHDISASAIQVGDVLRDDHHPEDERLIVKNNQIVNNTIHDIGVDYQDSIGVFVGYTDGTVIAHNEICHLPYTGISVGWGWGEEDAGGGNYVQPFFYDTPTPARNNRIEHNHVHHVMLQRQDGGGIYTLSNQPGTIIRGNHIHDNVGGPGGIYLDEGSGYIEVTGNSVYHVGNPMNYNNHAQNRIATCQEHDNFFGPVPGDAGFPEAVANTAGLEPAYRDLLDR